MSALLRWLWITCIAAIAISIPFDTITGTFWGLFAWLPWLTLFTIQLWQIRRRGTP